MPNHCHLWAPLVRTDTDTLRFAAHLHGWGHRDGCPCGAVRIVSEQGHATVLHAERAERWRQRAQEHDEMLERVRERR